MHMLRWLKCTSALPKECRHLLLPAAAGPRVNPQEPPTNQRGKVRAGDWRGGRAPGGWAAGPGAGAGTALSTCASEFSLGIPKVPLQIYMWEETWMWVCIYIGMYAHHLRVDIMIWLIWKSKSLSRLRLFATPWTIHSMEFSRPEYWSG